MKKTILTILLCGVAIIGITGCGNSKNEFKIGSKSNKEITTKKNITLAIKDGTLSNIGATFILRNDSDKLLHYEDAYEIEIKKGNDWYEIDTEFFVNAPLWELEQNKTKEIELNWEDAYGKLSKGKYRIIKKVYFEKESEQQFYISTEFNIDSD